MSISLNTGTTINRETEGYERLDESGRLISKREMRDEVEPFDLQRGDDSKNHRNVRETNTVGPGQVQRMAATIPKVSQRRA
jgi:hypothetical protein